MANRINVSLSDDLMDDLNNYRDQLPEKVSALCQKALNSEIRKIKNNEEFKNKLADNPKMQDKIKLLQKEREILQKDIAALGRNDGMAFVDDISLAELLDMSNSLSRFDNKKFEKSSNYPPKKINLIIAELLKKHFDKDAIDSLLSEVQKNEYLSPSTFSFDRYENPTYDEENELAESIIFHYVLKKFPQIKSKTNSVIIPFNKIYVGSFIQVVKSFYEVAKDQMSLDV